MTTKPFKFKLKKVDASKQKALEAFFDFLPCTGMRNDFHSSIKNVLSKHLNTKISYKLESVEYIDFGSFCNRLPDSGVVFLLGISPRENKIVADLDVNLASFFIERLLGGNSGMSANAKMLSEIEQGVLQYLALQVLSHIHRKCGKDSRLHFRFEKFATNSKDLENINASDEIVFVLVVRIIVGKNSGFIRLAFPSPLIEQLYLNATKYGEVSEQEMQYLISQLKRFNHTKTDLWADAGKTYISAQEIKGLEQGDVVLLDQTSLTLFNNKLKGEVILKVGQGTHGGFIANVDSKNKDLHCKIVDVYKGEDIL